jgi:PhnB protein
MLKAFLVFNGDCRDALTFYQQVFGFDVPTIMPYGDYIPEGLTQLPADLCDWVLHAEASFCGGDFWFADEPSAVADDGVVRLAVTVPTAQAAAQIFDKLSAGGKVTLPPTDTFYSTFHAAVKDKFGVDWNIVADEAPGE